MKMNIIKNYDDDELTLSVEGRVNTITSKDLKNEFDSEYGKFNSLVLDFSALDYISSAGLRVLIAMQKKLKKDEVPMVIKNVNDAIKEIFRISGFDRILTIE